MADMVETMANGKSAMAYVGKAPWHLKGQSVDPQFAYDCGHFMEESGLNWEAEKRQLAHKVNDIWTPTNAWEVVRVTDGKVLADMIGPNYTILQNKDAFQWFQPFLDSKEAALETAGSLCEGSRVWVLAKLNREPMEIAKDDLVEKYLLLSHAHDGTLAVRVGFSPVRVCCANTLAMAHSDRASKLIRIKHSKSVLTNLADIRETINLANEEFEATAEQYRLLASKSINQNDVYKYVKTLFNLENVEDKDIAWGKEEGHKTSIVSTRTKNTMEDIVTLMETGVGNNLAGVKGTWWAMYNVLTQYLTYDYAKSKKGEDKKVDSRLNSLWFGSNAKLNKDALELAVSMSLGV